MVSSYFFVFLSLGRTDEINKHTFYPYVHSFSNVFNKQSILRAISIPDVLPSDLPRGCNFSLVAGMLWRGYYDVRQSAKWSQVTLKKFMDRMHIPMNRNQDNGMLL